MIDPRATRRFTRHRGAVLGVALVVALVAFALVGPSIAARSAYESDFVSGATAQDTPVGPSAAHWLGTDRLFRDELARLAIGARISLVIAFAATLIATVLGALVGVIAGYFEGSGGLKVPMVTLAGLAVSVAVTIAGHSNFALAIGAASLLAGYAALRFAAGSRAAASLRVNADTALMRLVDVGLSFPFLLLVMALGAALDRTSVATILLTLGLTGWLGTARVVRARTLQVRALDFVVASRALGQSTWRILLGHILPNVAGPLIVISTASVAQMILAESVLSYLGVGISPPTPTWGHMLFEGQDLYLTAPWMLAAPAGAIVTAVFGFNLVGEGLRDALDPKT